MTWTISKEFRFEAAHSLPQLKPPHKCARTHGHSYRVELVLESDGLDERGFASVDYGELDVFNNYLQTHFDHQDLNIVMCGGENTTAERLAVHFYGWCKAKWPNLVTVRLRETPTTCVEVGE